MDLIDPSNESVFGHVVLGNSDDVGRAVYAARTAFPVFSSSSRQDRIGLLTRIADLLNERRMMIAKLMSREMGAPLQYAIDVQMMTGISHFRAMIEVLSDYELEKSRGSTVLLREPVGIAGLITPWNFPINQIASKVAPALAAGCTMVLKPSEISPCCASAFAQVMHDAETPRGVFNLVNGSGEGVGHDIATHPDIDMVSFTGSTRAGILIAQAAAPTVKRVRQELGGKSANIILPDADLERAVTMGIAAAFRNSGQSCSAPTRMLVNRDQYERVVAIASRAVAQLRVGNPCAPETTHGPLSSRAQFDKVMALIASGVAEGAELIVGGLGRPDGLSHGYYARPTIFGHVKSEMRIAREEIFGPVLSILTYESEDDAICIANDTPYGLAAYVQSSDIDRARRISEKLKVGVIHINYPEWSPHTPHGGPKQSGNGREGGEAGLEEFLELKAIIGSRSDGRILA
jgi:aldehyde dehydrogenase (NAD+)